MKQTPLIEQHRAGCNVAMDAALDDSRERIGPRLRERWKQPPKSGNGLGTRPGRVFGHGGRTGRLADQFHAHSVRSALIDHKFRRGRPPL